MLRRKVMLMLAALLALHMVMALLSIVALHGVLRDLDAAAAVAVDSATDMGRARMDMDAADRRWQELAEQGQLVAEDVQSVSGALRDRMDRLAQVLLGGGIDINPADFPEPPIPVDGPPLISALTQWSADVHDSLNRIESGAARQIDQRREEVVARFRLTALGLGIVFVAVINVTALLLFRTVTMVVNPLDELVEASRRLAREEFDYRVELSGQRGQTRRTVPRQPRRWNQLQRLLGLGRARQSSGSTWSGSRIDEFAELAEAYNALAEQLQLNEQRKVETLHQVARTLSHEINNAISIIELQITHLARLNQGDEPQAERLREIHRTLGRINRTIDALGRVRRIVLTDYTQGVSMLDLEQSVAEEPAAVVGAQPRGSSRSAVPQ